MKITEIITESESYQPPQLNVGDKILKGKFKNSPAEIKGFKKDKHNQPVLKTNKGDVQLFKPRVTKLMTNEGGWASTKTQNTVITPQFVANVRVVLQGFEKDLNAHLATKNLPPIGIGHPCGSGTYYERDLKVNPTKEYGDIDVHFYIPRMPELNNNQTTQLFADNVKEFCNGNPDYETENGKNVIVKTGNDYVQVDLVTIYYDNKDWSTALAPEWNVKGVVSASLYSALGQTLNLSISSHGIQSKTLNGAVVPFKTVKNIKLNTITTNPETWAIDIAHYFGCNKISNTLKRFPGKKDEVRLADIIGSIKGLAETFAINNIYTSTISAHNSKDFMNGIAEVYKSKIEAVVNSSKFDKAASPTAVAKADYTKAHLSKKMSEVIAALLS